MVFACSFLSPSIALISSIFLAALSAVVPSYSSQLSLRSSSEVSRLVRAPYVRLRISDGDIGLRQSCGPLFSGSYISATVPPAGGAVGSVSGGTGCSGVGGHSEEVVAVAQGFGSRGLAVESEPIIGGGSVAGTDGCFDLKRSFSFSLVLVARFRSDMTRIFAGGVWLQ